MKSHFDLTSHLHRVFVCNGLMNRLADTPRFIIDCFACDSLNLDFFLLQILDNSKFYTSQKILMRNLSLSFQIP